VIDFQHKLIQTMCMHAWCAREYMQPNLSVCITVSVQNYQNHAEQS